ncbi:MAG: Glycosyltransferase involved in cell wall bisynthesis [Pelagibacterales bacterium]|nr:Glycosyltransferase involved in cell wall bisynthesis [Pelagibacterales bacterium]
MKNISILLPYKENFSPRYAGAVSLLVNDTVLCSKYKNNTIVYGSTDFKEKFYANYKNINFSKFFFESSNIKYAQNFLKLEKKFKSDIIEIHNRPAVFNYLSKKVSKNKKLILYFHNDPLSLRGSATVNQRLKILDAASAIIFVSEWTKKRFFKNLDLSENVAKVFVVYPSVNKKKYYEKKEKTILFVGKLNKSKGYDLFCSSVIKILEKYPAWRALVIGDEPREKFNYTHPRLINLGFLDHNKVLKHYENASIAVGCSKWQEPLGRIGLEASSRGCATIVSNRGGLPETISHGVILNNLNEETLYAALDKLVSDSSYRKKICKLSYQNFSKNLNKAVSQIDFIRDKMFKKNIINNFTHLRNKKLRIMHITNFADRHNGRLYFVSIGQKLSRGFVKSGHSVLNFSDRDMIRIGRGVFDIMGRNSLNKKIIMTVKNYNPDLLLIGHADLIYASTLEELKSYNKNLKIAQWFEDPLIITGPDYLTNTNKVLDKLAFIDNTFVTTSPDDLDFDKQKSKFHYMPIPVDDSVERLKVFEINNPIYDLFFAMSHGVNRGVLKRGKKDGREEFLENLISRNPTIKFDIYGLNGRQPIWAESFFNIVSKSKMALNLSRGIPKKYYSSNRIASLVGNGLLTFIDEKTKFDHFFNKDELVFYKNLDDLSEKIQKYSFDNNARKKIAQKGWEKYHKHFNSKIVADYMINKVFNFNSKSKTLWDK